jgi:hypothetical protein
VPLQVDELLDHLMLAWVACPESCRETVDLGVVFAEVVETGSVGPRPRVSRVAR